ncbi:hypothetical protein ACP4OV_029741 [Aristida adscensionis]
MVPTRKLLHHDGNSSSKSYYYLAGQYSCAGGGGIAAELEAPAAAAAARQGRKQPRSREDADEQLGMSPRAGAGAAGAGDDGDWLQLGLATASSSSSASSSGGDNNGTAPAPSLAMELDLFTSYDDKRNARMRPPLFPLPLRSYGGGHGRFRRKAASASMSAPAPFLPSMPPFTKSSGDGMRVISPPRRTEAAAGLWLTLQAAPNQAVEPILPQIPKSYLRIKDSNIKVEVVMKYLADKLGLTRSHQCRADMQRAAALPVLAGEIRERQHLVLLAGDEGGRGGGTGRTE